MHRQHHRGTLDRLNSHGASTDHQLVMARRVKRYVVSVTDAEGITREYVFWERSRRRAKAKAQSYWGAWGATLVEVSTYVAASGRLGDVRRLFTLAGLTFAVAGVTIAAMMLVSLRLEGAL
jgi:hypothetical protein